MDPRLAVLGRTPPPAPLGLVTDLLDTWFGRTADGVGEDGLRTPADLAAWCRARGTEVADDAVGPDDLDLARTVRAGLRAVLARHTDPELPVDAEAVERFDDAAAGLRLRVRADPFRLEPDEERAVRRVLATVVAAPLAVDDAHLGAPQGLPRPAVPDGVLRRLPQRFGCLVLDERLRRGGQAARLRRAAAVKRAAERAESAEVRR